MTLLLALALAAVAARALVPVGYMLAARGDQLAVTLCGSGGSATIDFGGDHPAPAPRDDGACAFAVASVSTPPPVAPALAAPAAIQPASVRVALGAARVGQGLAAPPPPARGPPVPV